MSILNDLLKKKITFNTAVSEFGGWVNKLAGPANAQMLPYLKQGASNLIALADSELAPHYDEAVTLVTNALDGLLLKSTNGIALPAIPLVNKGLHDMADVLKHAIDVWVLETEASLKSPAPSPALNQTPVQHPLPLPLPIPAAGPPPLLTEK